MALSQRDRQQLKERVGDVEGFHELPRKYIISFPSFAEYPAMRLFKIAGYQIELVEAAPMKKISAPPSVIIPPAPVKEQEPEVSGNMDQNGIDDLFG